MKSGTAPVWRRVFNARRHILAAALGVAGTATVHVALADDEIVVTARKRSEKLDSVSEAMTILTPDALAASGITTSPEIVQAVPGLMWQSILGFATPNIFLRGIGNATFNANQASPIGIYRDGVYQGSSPTYGFGLFDLDRVEVLKGPQGTLFGRNTTGGVIDFISHKPDVGEGVNGYGRVTYGRFNETDFEGAVGTPLGDTAALRLAGQSLYRDGYVSNRNPSSGIGREGKLDMWSLRGQLRLEAGSFDVLLSAHGGRNGSDVTPGKQLGVVCPSSVSVPKLGACTDFLGFRDTTNPRENFTNTRSYDVIDTAGADGTITWTGDAVTIVSQTAFDANHRKLQNDSDVGPYTEATTDAPTHFHQVSQELRALSNGAGPLSWIAGGNYYSDDLIAFTNFNLNALGPGALSHFFPVSEGAAQFLDQATKSYAVFAEANYRLLDGLTVTGGVRWTRDRRTANVHAYLFNTNGLASSFVDPATADARVLVPTIPAMTISRAWSRWSGRGVVSYEVADGVLAYAEIANGFKGGDFNGGALFSPAEANIVDPEYVTSYEAGVKGASADRRVTFDVSAFFYEFAKQQVAILIPGSHATLQQLANAGHTQSKGVDADIAVSPVEPLRLEVKASLLDSKFTQFQRDPSDPTTNMAGNRTAFSPKFSFDGVARYSVPLTQQYTISLQGDGAYKGAHFFTVDNSPTLKSDGYWLLNASLELARVDNAFSLSAWMKNATDTHYIATGLANSGLGFFELIPGLPRTFGLTLSARY